MLAVFDLWHPAEAFLMPLLAALYAYAALVEVFEKVSRGIPDGWYLVKASFALLSIYPRI